MTTSPNFSQVSDLLNKREVEAIIQFWDTLMENRKLCAKIGTEILLTAMTRDPSIQPKFKIFEGMSLTQIRSHKKLAAHGQYVAYTFANIISQMDDPALARSYIFSVTRNHHKRGITIVHFRLFFSLLIAIMKKRLPPEQFTDEMYDINRRGFRMLFAMFEDCHQEIDLENPLPRVESFFMDIQDIQEASEDIYS